MPGPMRWRPLEILNLVAVSCLLALATASAAAGRLKGWPTIIAGCLGGLAVVFVAARLARRRERLWPPLRLAVDFYPLAFVPFVYDTLGLLIPAVHPAEYDAALSAIDFAVFGVHPTLWLQRFTHPVLTDLLYLAYATFFLFPLVVGVALWRRSPALARRFIFLISLTFFISYVGYVLLPAQGPRAVLAGVYTVNLQATPIARTIATTLNDLERNRVDVFPSGHTMITVVCLLVARRHARRLFCFLLPVGTLLVIATVYCRYHYVIDVIVGLALALPTPALGAAVYRRLGGDGGETDESIPPAPPALAEATGKV